MTYIPTSLEYNQRVVDSALSEDARLRGLNLDLIETVKRLNSEENPFYNYFDENYSKGRTSPLSPHIVARDFSLLIKGQYLISNNRSIQALKGKPAYQQVLNKINALQIASYELYIKSNYDLALFERYAGIIESRYRRGDIVFKWHKNLKAVHRDIEGIRKEFVFSHDEPPKYTHKRMVFLLENIKKGDLLLPSSMSPIHVFASQVICHQFRFSANKYRFFDEHPELWGGSFDDFLKEDIVNAPYIYKALTDLNYCLYTQEQYMDIDDNNYLDIFFSGSEFHLPVSNNSVFTMKRG